MATDYTAHNPANWQIEDGMTVFGSDGEKLGSVRNYDPQAGYLDIQKGWLFHKDFYVPLSAVQSARGEGLTEQRVAGASVFNDRGMTVEIPTETGITLRLTKDDLGHDRYSAPPVTGEDAYIEGVIVEESTVFDEAEPLVVERDILPGMLTH